MGAWFLVAPLIEEVMGKLRMSGRPRYAGRAAAASPATGLASRHAKEQAKLIDEALSVS
jgi:2-oxoglutarate dehydrogenase E1 component